MDFLPLQSEHGEVVALLSVACEVGHSLRHPSDERTGLGTGGLYHLHHPFLAKHVVPGIFRLVQTVGIEEECAARGQTGLLCGKHPIGHGADGQIMIDIDH